ncbi:MAG TPA: DegT/DnrJ/EryC1/StrS family aminotransferase [Candidatus Elarobacter sp.]|jgi:dTDP-4-amino-4,6-dideoxygalactose transaminase
MIPFVDQKRPDHAYVQQLLDESRRTGTWTNFGPVSRRLERIASEMLSLPPTHRVVACASGTAALHALVLMYEYLAGSALRWVVSAFTFAAQGQGALADTIVLDCDHHGFLDADDLASLPPDSYDGVIVTNLFGTAIHTERYVELARQANKILIFDSATCFGSAWSGRPFGASGAGEAFSFHHTKPCGFGEGGCVALPADLEDTLRSVINFGAYKGIDTGARSMNGKMSDVAAAFIIDMLRRCDRVRDEHTSQYARVATAARPSGAVPLVSDQGRGWLPSLVPLVFPVVVAPERLDRRMLTLKKYYTPLMPLPRAQELYEHVVSVPCHGGVADATDEALRMMFEQMSA